MDDRVAGTRAGAVGNRDVSAAVSELTWAVNRAVMATANDPESSRIVIDREKWFDLLRAVRRVIGEHPSV